MGTLDRIPSVASAKYHKNPITRHIIKHWKVPEGTKPNQLKDYQRNLLILIEDEKSRIAYQRKDLTRYKEK